MTRVIIFLSHNLFGQGVESLLRRESGLEIVARETDANKVIERIAHLRPDVAIVDIAHPERDPMPVVMRILRQGVVSTVIGLNLENNTMCVYREEQKVVKEVRDLVEAIQQRAAA